jgi:hypothetical protein
MERGRISREEEKDAGGDGETQPRGEEPLPSFFPVLLLLFWLALPASDSSSKLST